MGGTVGMPATAAAAREIPLGWQPLGGPGGRISHLAVVSASDLPPQGAYWYAVAVGGVNRRDDQTQWRTSGNVYWSNALYRSQDGGATWLPLTNDLPPGSISALYVDPPTGTLYAAVQGRGDDFTRRYGLWRSRDQGASWEQVPLGQNDLVIRRISRSTSGGGRELYLGAIAAVKYPSSYVFRSTDDGATWTRVQALRYEQSPGSTLVDLIPHPRDPARLFITTYGGEIYRSTDGGTTWLAPPRPEGAPPRTWPGSARLAISPDQPETMLVTRGQGGTNPTELTIERSTDGGITWTRQPTTGLPAKGGANIMAALKGGVFLLSTDAGAYRSADGGATWQLLEGPLNSGEVAEFVALSAQTVLAATGYGIFISRDAGALWQPTGNRVGGSSSGLPFNSRIAGLLTDARRPEQVYLISSNELFWDYAAPPLVMRSVDGGRTWAPAATGLPKVEATAWRLDPSDPNTIYVASYELLFRSTDAGLTWQVSRFPYAGIKAVAVAPSDPNVIYLGSRPALRSTDRGATWEEMPIFERQSEVATAAPTAVVASGMVTPTITAVSGTVTPTITAASPTPAPTPVPARQIADVAGLVVDPNDPAHLWAGLDGGGVLESSDGGRTWRAFGLAGQGEGTADIRVRWLVGSAAAGFKLYAGVVEDGLYRWDGPGTAWEAASAGLPEHSTILALTIDDRAPGTLWATRDGGGLYRSTDEGASWANAATGLGDNVGLSVAIDYTTPGGLLIGTATAGVWALRPEPQPSPAPQAVDARIEILWPHDWKPVTEAKLANLGLRLFMPDSLLPSPCAWEPEVTVWQAVDNEPAAPLKTTTQRSVDGQPFPFWELNDLDVSLANDPKHKLYFMVKVAGTDTATSVWAHGADPRTYFPQQDVPTGIATGPIDAVDTRIQIVWPHDALGQVRPVAEGTYANVAVAVFKHGTRLSVPVSWEPAGLTLYGAWDQEAGQPLARIGIVQVRQAGAITYPVWEFNNIPVARATTPLTPQGTPGSSGSSTPAHRLDKLYLWVVAEGVDTYPTIWTHGTDARTFFPTKDEPIQGCVP
jgi:photosystem II stability/assembly factor-like uncharacterized protein